MLSDIDNDMSRLNHDSWANDSIFYIIIINQFILLEGKNAGVEVFHQDRIIVGKGQGEKCFPF